MKRQKNKNTHTKNLSVISTPSAYHPWPKYFPADTSHIPLINFSFKYLYMTDNKCLYAYEKVDKLRQTPRNFAKYMFEWLKNISLLFSSFTHLTETDKKNHHIHEIDPDSEYNKLKKEYISQALGQYGDFTEVVPTIYQYKIFGSVRILWCRIDNTFHILFFDFLHETHPDGKKVWKSR